MEVFIYSLCIIIVIFILRKKIRNINYFNSIKEDERLIEVTQPMRGNQSERDLIISLLDYGIPPRAIFHDLYVKNGKYSFSQIDLVVATKVGLIVFEVKDYSGWIFGKGMQNQWTQVLKYGADKYRFYNPILQNISHIKALQKQSKQLRNLPFYSIIVFDGDCVLRDISFLPHNTFVIKPYRIDDVLDIIFEQADANYTDKIEVMKILKEAVHKEIMNKHR